MKPLLKWPGGKAREVAHVLDLIPEFNRYLEPFFGGGAMFFELTPEQAAINDVAKDLMEFYQLVQSQDPEFREQLFSYARSFQGLLDLGRAHGSQLLELFCAPLPPEELRARLSSLLQRWTPDLMALFPSPIVLSQEAFLKELEVSVLDKLLRTRKNHQKRPFSQEDLVENLVTGLSSGYYLYFRSIYNDWNLGRITLSPGARMANFFFIRETCYGSMFRYNRKGEFNIPYGGMSYNGKDLEAKVEALMAPETCAVFARTRICSMDFEDFFETVQPREGDFIFLDPPYDTEFSDYEGSAFTKFDHARLAVALSKTKAKFLLIIKNTPFIEALYQDRFYIRRFDKRYSYNVRSRNDRTAEHLVVTNYPIDLEDLYRQKEE